MANQNPRVWVDGKLVDWEDARTHLVTHTLHYGLGAFEGIRSYRRHDGRAAIFRLQEHIDRLFESCQLCQIDPPFSRQEMSRACVEVVRDAGLTDAYLRPLIYLGPAPLAIGAVDVPAKACVIVRPFRSYFGAEAMAQGIRCNVSSYVRAAMNASLAKGKICGQYALSVLAKRESQRAGYDEGILLDGRGHVAEGTAENVFVVHRGKLMTPPLSLAVLAGITRETVLTLARELAIPVEETSMARDQLYCADEVFLTGTAGELTPVREIDGRRVGSGARGEITKKLQDAFFRAARGDANGPFHNEWLTFVDS